MFSTITEAPPIRVIFAEPQGLFLQGALRALEDVPDIDVVATAATAPEAIKLIQEERPDVAVIAVQLPGSSGLGVLEVIDETVPLLMFSSEEARGPIFEAMTLGARGYLSKWYADVTLDEAIRLVAKGEIVMDRPSVKLFVTAVRDRISQGSQARGTPLSKREREVLVLMSRGYRHRRIADELGLSIATIRTHSRNAYVKLGVSNQAAAVTEAFRRGLIKHEDEH